MQCNQSINEIRVNQQIHIFHCVTDRSDDGVNCTLFLLLPYVCLSVCLSGAFLFLSSALWSGRVARRSEDSIKVCCCCCCLAFSGWTRSGLKYQKTVKTGSNPQLEQREKCYSEPSLMVMELWTSNWHLWGFNCQFEHDDSWWGYRRHIWYARVGRRLPTISGRRNKTQLPICFKSQNFSGFRTDTFSPKFALSPKIYFIIHPRAQFLYLVYVNKACI